MSEQNTAQKIAVVLFNLGGPDSLDAVKPFLFNLFNDRAIISLPQPLRWFLAKLISTRRTPVAQKIYSEIGGRSPILDLTNAQSAALEKVLQNTLGAAQTKLFVAMRYWHPFANETAIEVKKFNPDKIILLPLYPQYSTTTSASSIAEWKKVAHRAGIKAETTTICCWPVNPGFIEAQAKLLIDAISSILSSTPDSFVEVLFSAHGLPKRTVERTGDPYPEQVIRGAEAIVSALHKIKPEYKNKFSWQVSYQSRVGPLEWIGPATEDEIKLAGQRRASLVVLPIAFVSEHSETLVELDIEYREVAIQAGVKNYIRVPAVGTQPDFINGLGGLVAAALQSPCNPMPGSGCNKPCEDKTGACPCAISG
ncbi:MAG: ferrochelatase [Rhodospirillaceae bacterium]|nr:ferrochelatase [Rhodospirillaceae bacterium]